MKDQPAIAPSDLVNQRRFALSRRQFLRGVGVSMALPLFESTLPGRLRAASAPLVKGATGLATTASGAPLHGYRNCRSNCDFTVFHVRGYVNTDY